MSGIRINEIPRESTFDGAQDLVHVYKLVGGQYKSFSAPLNAVAFQGARGNDGVDGLNGQDGIGGDSVAQLVCYRRFPSLATTSEINAATPGLGSNDDGKFDFDQREFTPPTGWSAGVPPIESGQETYKLYVSNGVAKITGKSGVDDNIEWSNPEATGIQGLAGSDGVSTYQAVVFTRSDTQPAAPTGGSFNFGTDTLLSPISGVDSVRNPDGTNTHNWYVDTGGDLGPPGDAQLYMCNHQFSAPGDTGTDTATEWSVPTRFASDGANGISTYFGSIYKRTNSDISGIRPGAGDAGLGGYYDFRANQFVLPADSLFAANPSNSFNGWSEEVPAEEVAGQRTALWQSTVLASSSGSFLGSGDVRDYSLIWGEPVKVQQPAVDGNQGNAVTQVRAYLRSVGATPPVIGDLTNAIFNFENKILDVSNTSWSNAPFKSPIQPNEANYGNDFLYVSVGVASTAYDAVAGSYPNDTNINWADPILSPEDGEAAISTYLGQVYTRYAGSTNIQTTSRAPTGGSFNFSNSVLTVPTDPDDELTWTANIPTGFGQIYVSQRNFAVLGNSGTDNWNSGNPWSAPAILAYDGLAGSNGITNSRITLYYGSDNEVSAGSLNFPDDVTVSVNLDTSSSGFGKPTKSTTNGVDANITAYQVLSSNSVGTTQGTGWYTQLPSNDWIYVIEAVAADSDASDSNYIDTILGTEWSDAVAYRKPGSNGLAGLGTAIISLYKRTGTTGVPNPAEPSGPVKYYLGSGDGQLRGDIISIDSTNFNGWTKDPPSFTNSNDHYLWQINATASSRLCADKIFANEWSTPRIFSQNPFDLTETTVSHIIQAYIRSSVLPTTDPGSCTVALSGENAGQITAALSNGWSREIPDGDQQVYIAHATAAGSVTTITDTDTVSANEWSTPAKWGIVGEQGPRGLAGNVTKIITLYKRTTRNPSPVVVVPALDGNYDFNADSFTFDDPNNETWTLEIPAKQVNDKILWQTFATALCSQDSSVYNLQGGIDGDWSTPKAVIEDGVTITPVFSSNFDGVSASLDSVFLSSGEFKDHTHINFSDEYESIDSSQILTKTNGDTIAANTLTFIKIKGEQGITGEKGLQGDKGDGVLVAYAENADGLNVSESPATSRPFVKYHEYTGSKPAVSTLEGTSGFVKYKGEDANKIVPVYATSNTGANANLNPQAGSTHVSFIEDTVGTLASDFDNTWPSLSANRTFVKIKGNDGSSINILGTRATVGDLPTTSSAGDAYIIGGELHVSNGNSGVGAFTNVGQVQGPQGNTGLTGSGAQIHFKYANDTTGNGIPDTFTTQSGEDLGEFLGVATTNSTDNPNNTDPTNIGDYTFTKVKGDPLYTHIAYADNLAGTSNFTTGDPGSRPYIGISVNNITQTESSDETKYTWSKIVGQDGQQGIRGPVGSVPIFASAADGTNASLTQSDSRPFVFFYTGDVTVNSDTSSANLQLLGTSTSWKKITGDSLYTHIKYADRVLTSSDSASDMTDDPTDKKYIGISLNNTSATESTNPGDYTWSLIQGNAGRPDGCQAVYGYNNSDGPSSITYLEDENVLQLQATNNDTTIGMVYPAVDVTDGRTVQFTVSYKTPDTADINGVYIRIYEATTDLAEGKDRVGYLSTGTNRTVEQDNSPLIQASNRQHFWQNGAASGTNGGPGITVTPSSADLEDGPVSNEYKTVTITFEPDASSKYISLTILNWSRMDNKRLWVKPVRTTIVGDKGDKGTNSITTRLAEIFYKQSITLQSPAVTRQLLVLNTDSIITANPLQSNSNSANWRTIATDADGNSTTSVGATNIKMWHRTFPAAGLGTPAASITNSGWSYDDTTGIIKLTATQSGGTGGFGSYFRVANLKENTKYNVSGEFRIVEDDPGGTVMMVDMSDGSESDTTADGTDVFRVQTTSTSFTSFNVRGTMTSAKLDTISNLNGDTPYHYFIDFNILTQGSGAKNGTITGEFRNILIEEITNESAVSNTTYDISTGNLANVPSGWATIPPNAESGSKIYRSTAIVSYDADLETDTDAVVLIPDTGWGIPRAWSDGGNRTAPAVARLAFYQYLDSDYVSINNDNAPQSNYYSFRKASASSTTDVNNGWGSSITTAIDPITDIKQVLFTIAGKDDVQYNDFWKGLNTASEFIWKYGSSWILFQRTAAVDVAGSYTGVKVNVLDHSEDISQIRDLPAFYSTSNASIADVVFGYNPVFNKTTLSIYQRNNSITPPSRPVGSVTYSFADESITSGSIGSWSVTTPDAGDGQGKYLWVSNATAAAELDVTTGQYFDDITGTEWSFPRIMAQDGIAGEQGATYFTKFLYTRTTVSNPTLVSQWANSTTNNSYKPGQVNIISDVTLGNIGDVANDTISALTTTAGVVWSEDIPPESNGQFLWVIVAPVSNTPIGVVASNQWAEPALLSKDGVGLNSATVRLYKRTDGSTPSTGSSNNRLGFSYINSSTPTFTYNFSTGNLNLNGVTINGWSTTIPETGGNTLWVSRAIASGSGTTDEIGWGQWQVPEKLVTDGSGLIFIGSFNNRNSYLAHINNNNNGYNGVPPVNSYHIETGTDGRNVSYLYTGGPNTTDKNSGNNFDQLTIDGVQGQPGTSITFKGTAESLNGIVGASEGDVYRITGGTGPSQVYVRKSNAWAILTTDGDDGQRGVTGNDGNSVYICYSPLSIETSGGNGPTKPANNSNGNVGTTWYTSSIPPAGKTYHWMSQKIARTPTDAAIAWSEPIQISGSAGEPGFRTIALKIYKRSETQPNLPPSGSTSGYGAFDFENNKLLIPEGWSSTIANAGSDPDGTNPADPRDGKGYEWILGNGGSRSDSSTWVVGGKQNLSNLSNESRNALWSSEAIASIQANTVGQIDTDIYWTSPLQEQIDGIDLVDGSMDVDVVFGAVKNGGGVEKIVANDKQDPPQLLTQAAYDALADINLETHTAAERAAYGWSSTGIQIDVVQADTLYIIF